MDTTKILELLSYTLPAIVTAGLAYYFFLIHIKNEDSRRNFQLLKENQKQALPIRLQAFERMTLFLERISPEKLLVRVAPVGESKEAYLQLLHQTIEQEFEYNLAQQIYMTEECWNVIITSKNATINIVKREADKTEIENAQQLREAVLQRILKTPPPSNTALSYIKNEVSRLF